MLSGVWQYWVDKLLLHLMLTSLTAKPHGAISTRTPIARLPHSCCAAEGPSLPRAPSAAVAAFPLFPAQIPLHCWSLSSHSAGKPALLSCCPRWVIHVKRLIILWTPWANNSIPGHSNQFMLGKNCVRGLPKKTAITARLVITRNWEQLKDIQNEGLLGVNYSIHSFMKYHAAI